MVDFAKLRIEVWMQWLNDALESRFSSYVFRFGIEYNMETQVSVLIVQYDKLGKGFQRMGLDKPNEVFITDYAHDNKITDKIIARLMLLGLDEQ